MTTKMIGNKYIDISVHEGGIPGLYGCVELTSALTQLLNETRMKNNVLKVVWFDLANAYGSIPKQIIRVAL